MSTRGARRLALLGALLLGALGAAGMARAETQVYRPQHRLAAELLPFAETALGGRGRAVVDPGSNALVLLGPAEALADARALLAEMDRALRNVRLHYAEKTRAELDAAGLDVRWSVEQGPVRIGNARRRETGVEVRAEDRETRRREGLAGRVSVLEGQSARIETGRTIPVETGGFRHRRTQLLEASSGFEVTPRILGDGRIRLELRPYGARLLPDGRIATSGAETVLVLSPGETAVLGGLGRDEDVASSDTLSGAGRREVREERLLLIRAELP